MVLFFLGESLSGLLCTSVLGVGMWCLLLLCRWLILLFGETIFICGTPLSGVFPCCFTGEIRYVYVSVGCSVDVSCSGCVDC